MERLRKEWRFGPSRSQAIAGGAWSLATLVAGHGIFGRSGSPAVTMDRRWALHLLLGTVLLLGGALALDPRAGRRFRRHPAALRWGALGLIPLLALPGLAPAEPIGGAFVAGMVIPLLFALSLLAAPWLRVGLSRRWWGIVVGLVLLFRVVWFPLGLMPRGFLDEEHRTAQQARYSAELWQSERELTLPKTYPASSIPTALAFLVFGPRESTYRGLGILLGVVSALLFAATMRRRLPPGPALATVLLFLTSLSTHTAMVGIEESFALALFIVVGTAFYFFRNLRRLRPLDAVPFALFAGLAFTEYAAVKPYALCAIALVAWRVVRRSPGALRRPAERYAALAFATTLTLFTFPVVAGIAGGGNEFFDGRSAAMVGSAALPRLRESIAHFGKGLHDHLAVLLLPSMTGWSRDHDLFRIPFVDPVTGLFVIAALGLAVVGVAGIGRRRGRWSVRDRRLAYGALGAGASVLAMLSYCSYWNWEWVRSYRFIALWPVIAGLGGAGMTLVERALPFRRAGLAVLVVASLATFLNAKETFDQVASSPYRRQFASKAEPLCAALQTMGPEATFLMVADWRGGGLYLGDSDLPEWLEDTSSHGYDSWGCRLRYRIHLTEKGDRLPAALDRGAETAPFVIFGTRVTDYATLSERHRLIDDKLAALRRQFAPTLDVARCFRIFAPCCHAYEICRR